MSEETRNAQPGIDVTQTAQTDNSAAQNSGVSPGVQKRFDEMTARYRTLERNHEGMQTALVEAQRTNSQLMQELIHTRTPPKVDPVLDSIDPEDRQKFMSMFQAFIPELMKPLEQRISALQGSLTQTRATNILNSVEDTTIREEAAQLIHGFSRAGVLGTVATEEDAVLLAKGRAYDRMMAETAKRNFNESEPPLSGSRGAPVNGKKSRFDVGAMSQEDILTNLREIEKEMGDSPF